MKELNTVRKEINGVEIEEFVEGFGAIEMEVIVIWVDLHVNCIDLCRDIDLFIY